MPPDPGKPSRALPVKKRKRASLEAEIDRLRTERIRLFEERTRLRRQARLNNLRLRQIRDELSTIDDMARNEAGCAPDMHVIRALLRETVAHAQALEFISEEPRH